MTRQYAIDKAKLFYRQHNQSYYVVRESQDEYAVWDKRQVDKALADGSCRRDAIIFSIEHDEREEEGA